MAKTFHVSVVKSPTAFFNKISSCLFFTSSTKFRCRYKAPIVHNLNRLLFNSTIRDDPFFTLRVESRSSFRRIGLIGFGLSGFSFSHLSIIHLTVELKSSDSSVWASLQSGLRDLSVYVWLWLILLWIDKSTFTIHLFHSRTIVSSSFYVRGRELYCLAREAIVFYSSCTVLIVALSINFMYASTVNSDWYTLLRLQSWCEPIPKFSLLYVKNCTLFY